ncbi:aspartate-semialdehyde dehydrogenase-like protein [Ceratocystis lukuohia]|uniref:non-reducing end alpha-L-arabinofuranosidase n=1 Tax=Ceratocystis lukuohia TaxID=2019550 RepID=A0ABR4MIX6_9PEZI
MRLHTILAFVASVAAVDITVSSSGGNKTSGHQYGFLHEDINNSGDGGIYAELIRNRAFQFSDAFPVSLDGWASVNSQLSLQNVEPPLSSALPTSVRVTPASGASTAGLSNDGYWGMSVKKQRYIGSFWVHGGYKGSFNASFVSALDGTLFGSVSIESKSVEGSWTEHEVNFVPTLDAPNSNNTFVITFETAGLAGSALDFNLVSVFPPTYKNRQNGLRTDLAEVIADIKPRFFRFPGGNMLEGNTVATRWDWKQSLGPLKDRPGFPGVWGYQQTNGLGLLEYLYWAEDMGMESVLAVWGGLALDGTNIAEEDLQPYIDDALNEIEFVVGSETSTWGAKRAALGRKEPFKLNFVEVGNEDWLEGGAAGWEAYKKYRFPMFQKAILAKYPTMTIISSGATSDGYPDIPQPALGDYHPYRTPDDLVKEFSRFDNDAIGHIVGEVAAVHPNGGTGWNGPIRERPWWIGSVGEAISLIGYERNADRVRGSFYAPIIRSLDRYQWPATLVQFAADPALTTRSTSWHIWHLVGSKQLVNTLPATKEFDPLFYVAGVSEESTMVWKGAAYNTTDGKPVPVRLNFDGVNQGARATFTLLTGPSDSYGVNTATENVVKTSTTTLTAGAGGVFEFDLPQLSVALLETV